MSNLTHIDLFSGIGGFALACKWNSIETIQFVEIDKFCQKILNKNFKGVPIHGDIKTFKYDGASPFILTGGFPCQPFSVAGKRRGKEDDRSLWHEMFRVIQETRPSWIIGENVIGFVHMGLDDCISDLEREGYSVQPFIIPACAVQAQHRRDMVWIVANTNSSRNGASTGKIDREWSSYFKEEYFSQLKHCGQDSYVSNTKSIGLQGGIKTDGDEREKSNDEQLHGRCGEWNEPWIEVATRLCRVDDGIPKQMDRIKRLKALGNSIVPQVAYIIIKYILEVERNEKDSYTW